MPALQEPLAAAPPGPVRDLLEAILAPLDDLDEAGGPAWREVRPTALTGAGARSYRPTTTSGRPCRAATSGPHGGPAWAGQLPAEFWATALLAAFASLG